VKTTKSPDDLPVFIGTRDTACAECGEALDGGRLFTLRRDRGALCLACADLAHLLFLGAGDAALTRRARKASTLSAVVLRWSKARKRYERQGLLVEEEALERAESECLADADARARRRERETERRTRIDEGYVRRFAAEIRKLHPSAPAGVEEKIARHACLVNSGRVGRSAGARSFEPRFVELAVGAWVRHRETDYDALLAAGLERDEARDRVGPRVREILRAWAAGSPE